MKTNKFNSRMIIGAFLWVAIFFNISNGADLPIETSNLFSGSGNCAQCHASDGVIFTTNSGKDISPVSLWQSTMMANSAKDPFWQAKVSTEVAEHPALQSVIEDKCTTCHMPMGKTEAIHNGADHYAFNLGLDDALSLDGVSCTLCHQIQNSNLGAEISFSGGYEITNDHNIFGPFSTPLTAPMFNQTGYTPVHSTHVNDSELCATCHTLFTPYVDDDGQVAGYFPEQTPYLEWENSVYPADSVGCQTCHMPTVDEEMKIATRPAWLSTERTPIWEHDFVGGNVFMNTLLKNNSSEIGVTATDAGFDSTRSKTLHMLREQTIDLSADTFISKDTLYIDVILQNLSGHKFPTGFPSRRAWIHVKVENDNNDTIFESGNWDENGEIVGLDEDYEPHHQLIQNADQVQIYQAVMKDVNDEVTYTLLRGAAYAKDNRLPPAGFTRASPKYESIAIHGAAANDPDFNNTNGIEEGSGSDRVQYQILVTDNDSNLKVTVSMYYQSIAPRFVQQLNAHSTDEVGTFLQYYDSSEKAPVLLKSLSMDVMNTGVDEIQDNRPQVFGMISNYPNPFNSSTVIHYEIDQRANTEIKIFDVLGRNVRLLVSGIQEPGAHEIVWDGTDMAGNALPSGVYIAIFQVNSSIYSSRLLLLK